MEHTISYDAEFPLSLVIVGALFVFVGNGAGGTARKVYYAFSSPLSATFFATMAATFIGVDRAALGFSSRSLRFV